MVGFSSLEMFGPTGVAAKYHLILTHLANMGVLHYVCHVRAPLRYWEKGLQKIYDFGCSKHCRLIFFSLTRG